ncbi:Trimethylguanosine synthase [Clonorchis sinensis]|uniref:Trimethylguanosine synthase n=1 Tax=Clonorchis sinensis TaxID=79923 RepID=A0A8T1LYR8_CLOSI|nr:Trimethylguanosine synthase [Clonorchis sinensis]
MTFLSVSIWEFNLIKAESWYSVTPECIARRQANACACDLIVDAFAGVGGNAIQFARTCSLVVAIDNNYTRLLLLKHNAQVYGVSHNILPICGDAVSIICSLRSSKVPISDPSSSAQTSTAESAPNENCLPEAGLDVVRVEQPQDLPPTIVDVIFLSPPWGGPGYHGVVLPPGSSSWNKRKRRHWFQSSGNAVEPTKNLENIPLLLPALRAACHICHRILVYLPRSCSIGQMLRLSWPSDKCDCQMCGQYRAVSLEEYLVRGRRVALGLHIGTTLE